MIDEVNVGTPVHHKKYGFGEVVRLSGNKTEPEYIEVKFHNNPQAILTFQYPDSIGSYLRPINHEPIRKILEKRKIKHLIHFTRVENLESILQYGFVPRSMCKALDMQAICNDDQRLDGRIDCNSISVEFPNYRLLRGFQFRNQGAKWVIFKIDVEALFDISKEYGYYKTNAANSQFRSYECRYRSSVRDFEEMFCEDIEYNGTHIRRKDLNIPDKYTTDPQAEILISGIIEPKFIRRICFASFEDMQDYKNTCRTKKLESFDYGVEPSLFGLRKDYTYWK